MRLALFACLAALMTTGPARAQATQAVFRLENETVSIYATVQSGDHLVTGLTRDEFEVLDNGRPQPITLFENGVQPINIVVMLDMSGSMTGNLPLVRNAAVQMFTRLLPGDRARVGSIGERIALTANFTSDQETLIRALWTELPDGGGGTPLWTGIDRAMRALSAVEGRRVVLVLSDGKDNSAFSAYGAGAAPIDLESLMRRAQSDQFTIYAIGLRSRSSLRSASVLGADPDPGLRELATESGGGYFELDAAAALGDTFARVADELHRQYLLGFALPEADGKKHTVEVRLRQPDLTVRARKSYIAPKKDR